MAKITFAVDAFLPHAANSRKQFRMNSNIRPKFKRFTVRAGHFAVMIMGGLLVLLAAGASKAATVWLDDLDLGAVNQSWGDPHKNRSVEGHPLSLEGQVFERGLGTHAESTLYVRLEGNAKSFSATVGVDDEVQSNAATVQFQVYGDNRLLWQSRVLHSGDGAQTCNVVLKGVQMLLLKVGDPSGDIAFAHADWAAASFEMANGFQPVTLSTPDEVAQILTPAAPAKPRINGAAIQGVRPGSPFLYTIAATGERPMTFSAKHLPDGLSLDPLTGRITGTLNQLGTYQVTLKAKNRRGSSTRSFTIVVGSQIALTPPMGWNSWNCFAGAVSEDKVKAAAKALVESGLADHGWTYVNVDDFWQNNYRTKDPTLRGPYRDAQGNIQPNARFPDMKGLADYIHSLGLKAGLYSSPGPWTCGGCAGSWRHEAQDAAQYAAWGFDYLKYDWCSYEEVAQGKVHSSPDLPTWQSSHGMNDTAVASYPYNVMGLCLRAQPRDIFYSLCQYGMQDVWKWGESVQGNAWRTTGDINDSWSSMSRIGFRQDPAAPYAGPGHWNDPDMLVVGKVGWGHLHPTRLTPNEQYTHISLWCLLSAPLLIGCDLTQLDPFTLNLLENDEVLAVDQDTLGREATTVWKEGNECIYAKPLSDGSKAVGLFNLGETPTQIKVTWTELGLKGRLHVRDLWRQKDLGRHKDSYTVTVPRHGVALFKVW